MDNLTSKEALYEEVMTAAEAAERWGKDPSTVQNACSGYRKSPPRFTAAEARKAGRIWLVTRAGMERVFGKRKDDTTMENTIKMYLNYNVYGWKQAFSSIPSEIYDEIELILPEGAKLVELEGGQGIEFSDDTLAFPYEIRTKRYSNGTVKPYFITADEKEAKYKYCDYRVV